MSAYASAAAGSARRKRTCGRRSTAAIRSRNSESANGLPTDAVIGAIPVPGAGNAIRSLGAGEVGGAQRPKRRIARAVRFTDRADVPIGKPVGLVQPDARSMQ